MDILYFSYKEGESRISYGTMNLMKINGKVSILIQTWSKAIQEAKRFGETIVVGDSSDKNFSC